MFCSSHVIPACSGADAGAQGHQRDIKVTRQVCLSCRATERAEDEAAGGLFLLLDLELHGVRRKVVLLSNTCKVNDLANAGWMEK